MIANGSPAPDMAFTAAGLGKVYRTGATEVHALRGARHRSRERALGIGHINDEFGEVLDGLAEGQQVVLNPGNALADGTRIKPR